MIVYSNKQKDFKVLILILIFYIYLLNTHLQSCSWQFPWSYMHISLCICVCVVKSWVMCYFSVSCASPDTQADWQPIKRSVTFQSRHANKLAAKQTLTCQKNAIYNASSHDTHTHTLLKRHTHLPCNHQKVPLQTHAESHKSKYKSLLPWTYSINIHGFPSPLPN